MVSEHATTSCPACGAALQTYTEAEAGTIVYVRPRHRLYAGGTRGRHVPAPRAIRACSSCEHAEVA